MYYRFVYKTLSVAPCQKSGAENITNVAMRHQEPKHIRRAVICILLHCCIFAGIVGTIMLPMRCSTVLGGFADSEEQLTVDVHLRALKVRGYVQPMYITQDSTSQLYIFFRRLSGHSPRRWYAEGCAGWTTTFREGLSSNFCSLLQETLLWHWATSLALTGQTIASGLNVLSCLMQVFLQGNVDTEVRGSALLSWSAAFVAAVALGYITRLTGPLQIEGFESPLMTATTYDGCSGLFSLSLTAGLAVTAAITSLTRNTEDARALHHFQWTKEKFTTKRWATAGVPHSRTLLRSLSGRTFRLVLQGYFLPIAWPRSTAEDLEQYLRKKPRTAAEARRMRQEALGLICKRDYNYIQPEITTALLWQSLYEREASASPDSSERFGPSVPIFKGK